MCHFVEKIQTATWEVGEKSQKQQIITVTTYYTMDF
jgi:hypothetical protein